VTRTARSKAAYFGIVAALIIIILGLVIRFKTSPLFLFCIAILLLAPGRILGYFWRDLLRGLRLLNAKQYQESKRHSAAFLVELSRKPWLKKLIWLGSGAYSRDPESIALNNLSAAEIGLGMIEEARTHLEASIAIDAENPLPYWNLAVLSRKIGDKGEAERWFNEAKSRGFSRSATDKFLMASQSRFANTDGTGQR